MQPYEAVVKETSLKTIINELRSDKCRINLNPDYQRKLVWDSDLGKYFIESLCRGIISHHISFNKIDNIVNCIDGKQRLTSIKNYYDNGYKAIIINKNKYYNDLTPKEKKKLDTISINVVYYNNLNFDAERDVFLSIQSSVPLVNSEKVVALIKNNKYTRTFIIYRDSIKKLLKKFRYSDRARNGENSVLMDLLYIHDNGLEHINKKKTMKNMEIINIDKKISDIRSYLDPLLSINILNNPKVANGININIIYVYIYKISLKFENFNFDKILCDKLINIINSMHKQCAQDGISVAKTKNNFEKISNIFDYVYKNYITICDICYNITCTCDLPDDCDIPDDCDLNDNDEELDYCNVCDSNDCVCAEMDLFECFIGDMYTITKSKKPRERLAIISDNMRLYYTENDAEPLTRAELFSKLRQEGCKIIRYKDDIYVTNIKLRSY